MLHRAVLPRNQPDHGFAYLYYFIGRQERSQELIDYILDRFYGMGPEGFGLCGMDDAGRCRRGTC